MNEYTVIILQKARKEIDKIAGPDKSLKRSIYTEISILKHQNTHHPPRVKLMKGRIRNHWRFVIMKSPQLRALFVMDGNQVTVFKVCKRKDCYKGKGHF